jgi:hypothetical protein
MAERVEEPPSLATRFGVTALHDGTTRQKSTAQLQIVCDAELVKWPQSSSTFNAEHCEGYCKRPAMPPPVTAEATAVT